MSQINESAIKTPGVYVNEIPSFPPSIAQAATAVPVFIGYTQSATVNGKSVINEAVRITSMVQYAQYFGGAYPNLTATVTLNADNSVDSVDITPGFQLYNSVTMFYNHGGVNCYIISVGLYPDPSAVTITDFIPLPGQLGCFDILRKEDEPTLIVVPDAVLFSATPNNFYNLATTALQQCGDLQDRFTILDVLNGDEARTFDNNDVITNFRSGVGSSNLNYGAAYYPWLRSSLSYAFNYQNTQLKKGGSVIAANTIILNNASLTQLDKAVHDLTAVVNPFINTPAFAAPLNVAPYTGPITSAYGLIPITNDKNELHTRGLYIKDMLLGFIALNGSLTDNDVTNTTNTKKIHSNYIAVGTSATNLSAIEQMMYQLILLDDSYPVALGGPIGAVVVADFDVAYPDVAVVAAVPATYGTPAPADDAHAVAFIRPQYATLYSNVINYINAFVNEVNLRISSLEIQLTSSSAVYSNVTIAIQNKGIIVPPSGAIAGIYASVDGTRGVWKAPANVSLNTVIEPMVNINDNDQQDLNVDTDAGKSINAIRAFTGKGILVWGARTLDGNSNDFRYISVRRFFIMVEESVKLAAMQFVFEPNDGNTWVRVRAMIENYLINLWRQGALAGSKPEQSFYVKVGLGQTMIFDDILNGKMIIEIGLAPVRPAEFIILRFSQIQQTS
jgi:phage tail sheath protein FI